MKKLSTDELRECYLDFFVGKGHRRCASDVLVPKWDKSVLFTPAGMNPFKDHFLGKVELEFTRATSCQKCLRTGDIDNVGRTAYHHTFFEMLGNFSFGDYFKREAIHWAWEFLTSPQWLAIEPGRLSVTVYLDDDEAAQIWNSEIGVPMQRIQRMDEHDNFWPAGAPSNGPDGVCGPCSEIFYHPPGGGKEVEIWNLVFTQFDRQGDPPQNLLPLPNKNIDTGMGLERTAAQLQGVDTNFHIDILRPIVEAAAEVCRVRYVPDSDNGRRLRRITDHVRACTFAIHENVYPGAAKEEYVVRRLLRRAVLDGHQMGIQEPFLHHLVPAVAAAMRKPYPELSETIERVAQVIRQEEGAFLGNLDGGLARIEKIFHKLGADATKPLAGAGALVPGAEVADLYQTYGVPPELFETLAVERGLAVDWDGYRAAMAEHSKASGTLASSVMGNFGPMDELKAVVKSTRFCGYEATESETELCGLIVGESVVSKMSEQDGEGWLVLRETPFYAESGGQVGDTGNITTATGVFVVTDTQRNGDVVFHRGRVERGHVAGSQVAQATVDVERRQAIRRAHSATHILHHALQTTLGTHAQQRGSKVAEDWLRFDFANMTGVPASDLLTIEHLVNQRVQENAPVAAEILPLAAARERGAMMLFGEKYPDPVRMVTMGNFSRELCGGTHVATTGEIEVLEIQAEEGVSAGTRRIEALTGAKAQEFRTAVHREIDQICRTLSCSAAHFPAAISERLQQARELKKQVTSGRSAAATTKKSEPANPLANDYVAQRNALRDSARALNVGMFAVAQRLQQLQEELVALQQQLQTQTQAEGISIDDLIKSAQTVAGVPVIVQELVVSNPAQLRQLVDEVRQRLPSVALFLAAAMEADKVVLVAAVTNDVIQRGLKSGDWVKQIAPLVGGNGGGKPDFAQAGGKQPENIRPALAAALDYVRGLWQS